MGTVLIAGGTGMIGRHWIEMHGDAFDEVRLLSRTSGREGRVVRYAWDPSAGTYDPAAFQDVDYIINLAGAGIADRFWTTRRKQLILDSRTQSVQTLLKGLRETGATPQMILMASATGYYGDRGSDWVDEESDAGGGFLGTTTMAWEAASTALIQAGYPTAILRIGIVLSGKGGALPKLKMPLKMGMACYFGNGKQYMPWIHIDDLCRMMTWLLHEQKEGIWNGVAPELVTSREMADVMKQVFGGWIVLPVPAFALRLALGEMGDTVLTGARVRAGKVLQNGFTFNFANVKDALLNA